MNFWTEIRIKEALENAKTYNFPENWASNGLIIWQDNFQSGNMILAREEGDTKGITVEKFPELIQDCSAIITRNSAKYFKYNKPIIEINCNNSDAIIKMARYIRKFFTGKVIGITGSSGKSTTTQMLVDIFSAKHKTNSNIKSKANTTWGISWNMTRFNINSDYWIIETSLGGGLSRNSAIIKPDYAIITSVAPVHLTNGMTIADIAEEKSKIFHAMKSSSPVAVYSGITHFDIIKKAAEFKELKLITFGENDYDQIKIISNDDGNYFIIEGKSYFLNSDKIGKHILLDMAASLAIAKEENVNIEEAIDVLRNFQTLEGRGEEFDVIFTDNRKIHIVDESYNANPLSMKVAIESFGYKYKDKNKILVLGDMAECGENSEQYHKGLQTTIERINPAKILLCGNEIKVLYETLKNQYCVKYFESVTDLIKQFSDEVCDNDYIMVKSSHSGKLYTLINKLKNKNN